MDKSLEVIMPWKKTDIPPEKCGIIPEEAYNFSLIRVLVTGKYADSDANYVDIANLPTAFWARNWITLKSMNVPFSSSRSTENGTGNRGWTRFLHGACYRTRTIRDGFPATVDCRNSDSQKNI